MENEVRVNTHSYTVYWVRDNRGIRHLYHDHVAAQCAEDRFAREAKEAAKVQGIEHEKDS